MGLVKNIGLIVGGWLAIAATVVVLSYVIPWMDNGGVVPQDSCQPTIATTC